MIDATDDVTSLWSRWGEPVITILTTTPGLAALLIGLAIGFLGTQWLKGPTVLPHQWDSATRRAWVSRIAFFMYAVPCWLLWPLGWNWTALSGINRYLVVVFGLLAGIGLGFGSMWFYGVVMKYLYEKGWASEEKWSAEGRAAAKRQKLVLMASGEEQLVDEHEDVQGGQTIIDATKLAAIRDATKPKPPTDPQA